MKLNRFDLSACCLLLLSYAAVVKMPFLPNKLGDGLFHAEAKNLALALRGAPHQPVGFAQAPGTVIYYAIPYLVVSPGSTDDRYWQAAFVWTIGWMLLCLLLIRRTGERLGGPLTGKLAVILFLLTPFWAYYSYGVMSESPAFLGAVLFKYGWMRCQQSSQGPPSHPGGPWPIYVGLSLFVLSRPNALLLLGFALLAAAWLRRIKSPVQIRAAKGTFSAVAVVCLVLVTVGAVVRALPNHQQDDLFYWASFIGAFQYRSEPWNWNSWDKARRRGSPDYEAWDSTYIKLKGLAKQSGVPTSVMLRRWLIRDITGHPALWTRMAAVRTLALHISLVNSRKPEAFRVGPISGRTVYLLFHVFVNAVNFLLIGGAMWFLFTNRVHWALYWPLWGPWLSLVLFHAIVYAEPRYLLPSRPGVALMAAAALTPAVARVLARFRGTNAAPDPLTIGANTSSSVEIST